MLCNNARLQGCNEGSLETPAPPANSSNALSTSLMGSGPSKPYLSGKHVLITGGSEGIGLALAKECYKRSANVTLMARTASKLNAAVADVQAVDADRAGSVKSCPADVTKAEQASLHHLQQSSLCLRQHQDGPLISPDLQVAQAVSSLQQQTGSIDVVICCAGRAEPGQCLMQVSLSAPINSMTLSPPSR